MARRFFRRRSFLRRKPRTKWASDVYNDAFNMAGPDLQINVQEILTPDDYNLNDLLSPSGVTLVRVVGALSWNWSSGATEAAWKFTYGLVLVDVDTDTALIPRPDDSQSLVKERWLWTGMHTWSGADWNFERSIAIDVKQRARLRDSTLMLVCVGEKSTSAEAPAVGYNGQFRMLLAGDMT